MERTLTSSKLEKIKELVKSLRSEEKDEVVDEIIRLLEEIDVGLCYLAAAAQAGAQGSNTMFYLIGLDQVGF